MGMSEAIINGSQGYVKIPADKLVFGLPANIDAAANGFVNNPQDVYKTFDDLSKKEHNLKGVMTWFINWDEGKKQAGNSYNKQFSKDYKDLIYSGQGELPESSSDSSESEPENSSTSESGSNNSSNSESQFDDETIYSTTDLPSTGENNHFLLMVLGMIMLAIISTYVASKQLYHNI